MISELNRLVVGSGCRSNPLAPVVATFVPVGGPSLARSRRATARDGVVVSYGFSFAAGTGSPDVSSARSGAMTTTNALERYGESVLSPDWHSEHDRLLAMAEVADRSTVRVLQDLGVDPQWRCLEVGAGAGTIASWLAERAIESTLATVIGTDARWPRTFPAPLLAQGLTEVSASVHVPATGGRNASARCGRTLLVLRDRRVQPAPRIRAVPPLLEALRRGRAPP